MSHPWLLSSLCASCIYHCERICFCTTKPLGLSSFVLAALETGQFSARYASKLDHEFCFLWLKVSFHFQKNPQKKLLLFFLSESGALLCNCLSASKVTDSHFLFFCQNTQGTVAREKRKKKKKKKKQRKKWRRRRGEGNHKDKFLHTLKSSCLKSPVHSTLYGDIFNDHRLVKLVYVQNTLYIV